MKIKKIKLKNFRNYRDLSIGFTSGVHVFLGSNAQGKTNLLEALFLAVLSKSFRGANDEEMISWNEGESYLCVEFQNQLAEHCLNFRLRKEGTRENILNGQSVKKKDIIGYLNAVLFSPEDLSLIKGSPSGRRRFLDFEISQTQPVYYRALLQYHRALYQRNRLLKQIYDGLEKRNSLDIWDDQLSGLAAQLVAIREKTINQLSSIAMQFHQKITNGEESFSAHYLIFGNELGNEENYCHWYSERLRRAREQDIRRGATEFGPHKDDLRININSYDGKSYASQGQQRTAVLALKLAEIELMHQSTGEYPVLLLDDVMSELDEKRRINLIDEINGRVQTFITGTEKIKTLQELKPSYYWVEAGDVFLKNE